LAEPDAVDPHRPGDILNLLLADVLKCAFEPALDLIVHEARDADPARIGDALQSRGDVDAVAVNIAVFDDYIARVDADAELDALVLGGCIIPCRHPPLQRDGAVDRFDDAWKFDQDSVAGGLDDAPLVFGDLRVDQITAQRPEAHKGAGLVPFH